MPLAPKAQRIHEARSDAHRNRLISAGYPADQVVPGIAAWESFANGEGRDRNGLTYWDGCEPWVIEWMARRRDGRL